jgi:hypothetical protein
MGDSAMRFAGDAAPPAEDLQERDLEQVRIRASGSLAERFKAPVLKTGEEIAESRVGNGFSRFLDPD